MKGRNPEYRDTTAFRPPPVVVTPLLHRALCSRYTQSSLCSDGGWGWGVCVELPSILSASPRRVNCPMLDSIQGQQDPQTDCCRRQTVFSRHPILRSYGTVIGSGVQAAPRVCSSLKLLTGQTWRRPAISTEVPRHDANSRNASFYNGVSSASSALVFCSPYKLVK